jgi:predicted  nucleic acid-binding Zn-ribbon protein
MPKLYDNHAREAARARDELNRAHQIEYPLQDKIRILEATIAKLESALQDSRSRRDAAIQALDALVHYLATVKNA